jgi:hypothetical protein
MTVSSSASSFRPGVCLSTNRPVSPYEGQSIYETDTDRTLVWNGLSWITPNRGSWELVVPTSVSGGTILGDGSIQVNSSTTLLSVSGVFSERYLNYKIMVSNMTQASGADFGLRLNNSTGNTYASTCTYGTTGSAATSVLDRSGSSYFLLVRTVGGNVEFSSEITVFSPFASRRKSFQADNSGYIFGSSSGYDTSTNSSTGFSFLHGAPQGSEAFGNAIVEVYGIL